MILIYGGRGTSARLHSQSHSVTASDLLLQRYNLTLGTFGSLIFHVPVLIGVDAGYLGSVKNSEYARGKNAVVMTLMFT